MFTLITITATWIAYWIELEIVPITDGAWQWEHATPVSIWIPITVTIFVIALHIKTRKDRPTSKITL